MLKDHVAAISCGIFADQPVIDLDYLEDSVGRDRRQFRHDRHGRHRRDPGHRGRRALHRRRIRRADGAGQEGHCPSWSTCSRWQADRLRTDDSAHAPAPACLGDRRSMRRTISTRPRLSTATCCGLSKITRRSGEPACLLPLRPGRAADLQSGRKRSSRRRPDAQLPVPPHGTTGQGHCLLLGVGARTRRAGGPARKRPASPSRRTFEWPQGGRSIYFRDPAGNSLEFAEAAHLGHRMRTFMRKLDTKTIVVASHNAGKIREIRRPDRPASASRPSRPPSSNFVEPDETGTTFEENADDQGARLGPGLRPAGAFRRFRPGRSMRSTAQPGVYTANWAETATTARRDFAMAMEKVEKALREGRRHAAATAHRAASSACSALPGPTAIPRLFRGEVEGTVVWPPRGRPRVSATIRCSSRTAMSATFGEMSCGGEARLEAGRRGGAVAPRPRLQALRRNLPGSIRPMSLNSRICRAMPPASADTGEPGFGVYVHWPFCAAKCPYCDFNSHVRHQPVDQDALRRGLPERDGDDARR